MLREGFSEGREGVSDARLWEGGWPGAGGGREQRPLPGHCVPSPARVSPARGPVWLEQ